MTARCLVLTTGLSSLIVILSSYVGPSSAFGPNVCGRTGSLRHLCYHNPGVALRHRVPVVLTKQQQQPRPNNAPRAEKGGDDGGESQGGAGFGLDEKWEVETGEGAGGVSADDAIPGRLPTSPGEGQDWAGWAQEWRNDPKGKAERLVKRWESEEEERKAAQGKQEDKQRPQEPRTTENVPSGLSVTQTGSSDDNEGVVDWSKGQQLSETDRELNFAAEWQGHTDRINRLNPSERERLEATMRQALSKTKKKKSKKKGANKHHKGSNVAISDGSGSKGFGPGSTRVNAAGGGAKAIHEQEGGVEGRDETVTPQVAASSGETSVSSC